jgi:oligopeptidase B
MFFFVRLSFTPFFPNLFPPGRCDPSIPLTVVEWEEWGNPNEAKYFAYMKSYSPLDNVVRRDREVSTVIHQPREG